MPEVGGLIVPERLPRLCAGATFTRTTRAKATPVRLISVGNLRPVELQLIVGEYSNADLMPANIFLELSQARILRYAPTALANFSPGQRPGLEAEKRTPSNPVRVNQFRAAQSQT